MTTTTTFPAEPKAQTLRTRLALLTDEQRRALYASLPREATHLSDAAWRKQLDAAELPIVPAGVPVTELTVKVQTTSCSRCGGSGRYSWCQQYGDRCFRCAGSGIEPTKLGAKALAALDEWRNTVGAVASGDVQPGTVILYRGMSGKWLRRTVTEVRPGSGHRSRQGDGPWVEVATVELVTPQVTIVQPVDTTVRLPLAGALWEAYVAFAATLPGVIIEQRAAVTA